MRPCAQSDCKEKSGRIGFHVSPLFFLPILCFFAAGAGQMLPCALLAALLHELGHIVAVFLVGGRVTAIAIEPFGGEISTGGSIPSYRGELVVSLAGPAVNFFCALPLFLDASPCFLSYFALCSLGLGLFNLLPIKALDGGDILHTLLLLGLEPDLSDRICRIVTVLFVCLFFGVTLVGWVYLRFNPTLVLLSVYLLFTLF